MTVESALNPTCSSVVQASAGTGKTWLLTSRLLRLLLKGVAPDSIVAITFTRQAAAEMQQRLQQRLLDLVADDATLDCRLREIDIEPSPRVQALARTLYESLLSSAFPLRVVTFHSLCQELLRRFPFEAGIPPGYGICEQPEEWYWAAWDSLDRELTNAPEDPHGQAMQRLYEALDGLHATRKALFAFLDQRSDWWAYTEDQPDPIAHATAVLAHTLRLEPNRTDAALAPALLADLRTYAQLLGRHPTDTNVKHIARLERVFADPSLNWCATLRPVFVTTEGIPKQLRAGATLIKQLGRPDAIRLEALHASLCAQLLATEQTQRRQATMAVSRDWYLCGMRLLHHFQAAKHAQRLLDFPDLEWLAYRLLNREGHAEWVQFKLDQRIDHLLVDEFQDTNPTQWRLLQPLLSEMAAGDPERRRSVFLVGDAKQSIYRFRRAEPALFDAARDWLAHSMQAAVINQDVSWRSSPAILSFVDLLFARDNADAAYTLDDYRPHRARYGELWGRVEVLPLVPRDVAEPTITAFRNPLTTPRVLPEDLRHHREGELIAQTIAQLIGQPIGRDPRTLGFGDILVLLRDRTHAADYELALRRAGIPYVGADRGNFTACLEVRDLVALLTLLQMPDDDLALATVLRSPLFDASHAALEHLARSGTGAWYDRLLALTDLSAHPALGRARRLLPRWRDAVDRVPVHDLIDRIYFEGDVLARYEAAAPRHLKDRVINQLNRLLALALEADSGRFPSLARFIERLGPLTAEDTEIGIGADIGDRVRLMTVHAAKGLEAPVVFLANAARATGKRDRGPRPVIDWPADAMRPRSFHFVGHKDEIDDVSRAILERLEANERREESNLLYVALTRAQQLLYVSGCEPGKNGDARARRGWYGFIESRLAAAQETGRDAELGLTLNVLRRPDGEVFNVCGRLTHGAPPSEAPAPPVREGPIHRLDPALTRPLPTATPAPTAVAPSRQIDSEDDAAKLADDAAYDTAVRRGIIIHRALERLGTTPRAHAHVRDLLWQEWGGKIAVDEFESYWSEACAVFEHPAFAAFFNPDIYQTARNEVGILYAADGRDVFGVVDRLVWRGNDIWLLDYKTHRVTAPEITSMAARYAPQLMLYAEGAKRLWPTKRIRPVLIFTACREAVELPR